MYVAISISQTRTRTDTTKANVPIYGDRGDSSSSLQLVTNELKNVLCYMYTAKVYGTNKSCPSCKETVSYVPLPGVELY